MNKLRQAIEEQGVIVSDQILKVDTFLNHTVDPLLMEQIGKDFAEHFKNRGITKVITIESGGIAPALMCAHAMRLPLVFAKKAVPSTMNDPISTTLHSFTKNRDYTLCMERSAVHPDDVLLFVDDFLANGEALKGICRLAGQAGARVEGAAICIEKAWQPGHQAAEELGMDLFVLASIVSMSRENGIVWAKEEAE